MRTENTRKPAGCPAGEPKEGARTGRAKPGLPADAPRVSKLLDALLLLHFPCARALESVGASERGGGERGRSEKGAQVPPTATHAFNGPVTHCDQTPASWLMATEQKAASAAARRCRAFRRPSSARAAARRRGRAARAARSGVRSAARNASTSSTSNTVAVLFRYLERRGTFSDKVALFWATFSAV